VRKPCADHVDGDENLRDPRLAASLPDLVRRVAVA
jgi:hypothetical protein